MKREMSVSRLHGKIAGSVTGLTAIEGGYLILFLRLNDHETFITCFYLVS